MIKRIKQRKNLLITILFILIFAYLIYAFLFKSFYFRPISFGNYVDNTLRNEGCSFLGNPPLRSESAIYFNAYNYGYFPKSGVYKITDTFTTSECLHRFDFNNTGFPVGDFVYKDTLCYSDFTNISKGNAALDKISMNEWEREHFLGIKSPIDETPSYAFTIDGELYFNTDNNEKNIYRYKEKSYEEVLSENIVKKNYYIDQYYKNFVFLTNVDTYNLERKPCELRIDKFDINKKEIVQSYTIPSIQTFDKSFRYERHLITDNYLFLACYPSNTSNNATILRYNLSTNKFEKVFKTDNFFVFNAFNDNAYLAFKESGVFSLLTEDNELKKISDAKVNGISILDDKWLYYEGEDYHLYRIMPDGSKTEKVF